MNKETSRGQVVELVRQCGSGELGYDLAQAVIEKRVALTSPVSVREAQARILFDKFGGVLGCTSFEMYLDGTDTLQAVPQIPTFPKTHLRHFGAQNIWLIDGRVAEKVGIQEYCKLVGLAYYGDSDTLEAHDTKRARSGIRWMLGQDGYRNRNRKANDCREAFAPYEVGMDWVEGGGLYALDTNSIEDHYLDLPGSVLRENRGRVACMGRFGGEPRLDWDWGDDAGSRYGAASRSE